jgi:hypothetical protein
MISVTQTEDEKTLTSSPGSTMPLHDNISSMKTARLIDKVIVEDKGT